MAKFVEVRAEVLEKFLHSKGFARNVVRSEVVYERRHLDDPNVIIRVYTSIRDGRTNARAVGEDAIRVSAFYDNQKGTTFGLYKTARVYRVTSEQSIIDRMYARMRDAYKVTNQWLLKQGKSLTNSHNEKIKNETN